MKILSKDLRLGNYYEVDGSIYQVTTINSESFTGSLIRNAQGMHTNGGRRCPIELTPEILYKIGFKKASDYHEHYALDVLQDILYLRESYLGGYYWGISEDDKEFNDVRPIQYLHEFQNFYYTLTGLELEFTMA